MLPVGILGCIRTPWWCGELELPRELSESRIIPLVTQWQRVIPCFVEFGSCFSLPLCKTIFAGFIRTICPHIYSYFYKRSRKNSTERIIYASAPILRSEDANKNNDVLITEIIIIYYRYYIFPPSNLIASQYISRIGLPNRDMLVWILTHLRQIPHFENSLNSLGELARETKWQ